MSTCHIISSIIKRLQPVKVKSIPDFIKLAKQENSRIIFLTPVQRSRAIKGKKQTFLQYIIEMEFTGRTGKKKYFRELYFERKAIEIGKNEMKIRKRSASSITELSVKLSELLEKENPGIEVKVLPFKGEPAD